jgi:hypothetical protein
VIFSKMSNGVAYTNMVVQRHRSVYQHELPENLRGIGMWSQIRFVEGGGGGGLKDRWGPKRQGVVTNNNLTVFFIWATVNIYIKKIMKYNKSDHLLHVMTNKGTSYIIFTRKIWHDDIPLWKTKYKVCKCYRSTCLRQV